MPKVLITPEALVRADGPHIDLLNEAGFDVSFPDDARFTPGLGSVEEGVEVLSGVDAVVAGSEHIASWMLDRLPQLRVIARNGVGYDRVDVLSIHCPNTRKTRGMINRDVLERMKPTSILINTARGAIVNEPDLIAALQSGSINGAGLDVFEQEPPPKDSPLFELDNVVLTPHAAGSDSLAMRKLSGHADAVGIVGGAELNHVNAGDGRQHALKSRSNPSDGRVLS